LNFDEQILEAAKSITNAASVLIKAATAAQKELVAQGKVSIFRNKAFFINLRLFRFKLYPSSAFLNCLIPIVLNEKLIEL
jgi:hypothetical protein